MARPKTKECKAITVRMDLDTYDRLTDFCNKSGQAKTVAIERALAMYIDDYDKKMELLAEIESKHLA